MKIMEIRRSRLEGSYIIILYFFSANLSNDEAFGGI